MDHHSPTRSSERAIGQGMAPKLVRCMAGIWHEGLHFARQWRGQTRLYCPDRAIGERFMSPSFRRLPGIVALCLLPCLALAAPLALASPPVAIPAPAPAALAPTPA